MDDIFSQPDGPEPTPMGDGFVRGYTEAESRFNDIESLADLPDEAFINPFPPGTDEYRGFEEGVYDFTQK